MSNTGSTPDRWPRAQRLAALLCAGLLLGPALTGCATGDSPDSAISTPTTATVPTPTASAEGYALPEGFVHLRDVAPDITVELRYASTDNFTGRVVDGYETTDAAILRLEAAEALAEVQRSLDPLGLGLHVWDAFRPTRAVDNFVEWSHDPDDSTKPEYYPDHEKPELFELGYIAEKSRHSLGGTVDLTVIDAASGEPLDMGGPFDFFGELSHYDAAGLSDEQRANRALLRDAMEAQGFEPYPQEWWHFTYPLPADTEPSDFPVR